MAHLKPTNWPGMLLFRDSYKMEARLDLCFLIRLLQISAGSNNLYTCTVFFIFPAIWRPGYGISEFPSR